ncbi:hypothetical protein BDW42DRAFT_162414 [Aspergillus taichungensis]|uniref:Uncharacterized protein n=1 Tax=Aspergillus taichungensis TaxID=482145 RepID=A0A2J5I436_9EURO|nr:hypothetical protein BDW42DRAFT_162414 [Aspergillus taichungensis]
MYSATSPLTVTILFRLWVTVVLWFTKAMNFLKGLQQGSQRGKGNGPRCLFCFPRSASFFWIMGVPRFLVVHVSQLFSVHIFVIFSLYLWAVWTIVLFCLSHIFPFSCTLFHDIWWEVSFTFGWTWMGWTSVYNSQSRW